LTATALTIQGSRPGAVESLLRQPQNSCLTSSMKFEEQFFDFYNLVKLNEIKSQNPSHFASN
jgi:hypothetical protein